MQRVRFAYAGIRVRNLDRSRRFYRRLGFRRRAGGIMQHGGQWLQLESPGGNLVVELNYYPRGNRFYEPYRAGSEMDHFGFFVEDIDSWLQRAVRAGATREVEWTESGWQIAYVKDPDGIWLEFISRVQPAARHRRGRRPRKSGKS